VDHSERCHRDVLAHLDLVRSFFEHHTGEVEQAARTVADSLSRGGKVLFFGNGGSAADAQHLAAELVNRMSLERRALAGLALTTDSSVLTSIANDSAYDRIFSRQVEALGRTGDTAFAISTSGNAPSILQGLSRARQMGLATVGLLGHDGGRARALCDHPLVVESRITARIQEVHILIGHLFCEEVESLLVSAPAPPAGQ
jgi:D-sedoheptulose 7-phosphate isomerase